MTKNPPQPHWHVLAVYANGPSTHLVFDAFASPLRHHMTSCPSLQPHTTAFGMYWHFMDAKQMPNAVFYNLPARRLPTRPRLACIGTLWPNKCQTRSFIPCLSFLSPHDRVWHVLVVYAKRGLYIVSFLTTYK